MIVPRRDMLKGLALTGATAAFSGGTTGWLYAAGNRFGAAPQAPNSISILVGASSQSQVFLDGVSRASRRLGAKHSIVRFNGSLYDDLSKIEMLLRARQPIIALLDSADGVLLSELARGHGLRISFLGQHSLGGSDWPQRHQLTTLPQSAGVGSALLAGFGKQSYLLNETPLAGVPAAEGCAALGIAGGSVTHLAACSGTAATSTRPWAELLGDSLMRIACGSWRPAVSGPQAFVSRGDRGAELHESLTSILIHG